MKSDWKRCYFSSHIHNFCYDLKQRKVLVLNFKHQAFWNRHETKHTHKKENQIFCWSITPSLACNTWNLTSTCCNPHLAQVTDLNLDLWLLLQCQDQVLVLVTSVKIPKQFLGSLLNKCDSNNKVCPRTEWGKKNHNIMASFLQPSTS